jgi:dihydrofolate synthase/folylpolyglutamate synthase
MDAADLQKKAAAHGLNGELYPSVKKALKAAKHNATKKDMVLVAGSVFIVAEVL